MTHRRCAAAINQGGVSVHPRMRRANTTPARARWQGELLVEQSTVPGSAGAKAQHDLIGLRETESSNRSRGRARPDRIDCLRDSAPRRRPPSREIGSPRGPRGPVAEPPVRPRILRGAVSSVSASFRAMWRRPRRSAARAWTVPKSRSPSSPTSSSFTSTVLPARWRTGVRMAELVAVPQHRLEARCRPDGRSAVLSPTWVREVALEAMVAHQHEMSGKL